MSRGSTTSGGGSGGSSGSGATATPQGETVDQLVERYRSMVATGRSIAPMAADNLEYWLNAQGGTKVIPAHHFQNSSAVNSHLRTKHRSVFLSQFDPNKGIVPRLRRTPVLPTYQMTWEDSTYANLLTDLYFGLGGFTVKSIVDVEVTKGAGNMWQVVFKKWTAQVFDDYNWDAGKSVVVPGWGTIQDTDAIRVEQAGRAKSFLIQSIPWQVTDPTILATGQVFA
ncbi:MAG: hypothetical protein IT422_19870 [Pirellulaceae bacterium]|nr:hypothetical protein [Pirellulaceae bacterium]